jgi:hypothetical protein
MDWAKELFQKSSIQLRRDKRNDLVARRRGVGISGNSDGSFPAWKLPEEMRTAELADPTISDEARFDKIITLVKTIRDEDMFSSLLRIVNEVVSHKEFPYTARATVTIPRLVSTLRT